MKQPKQSTLFVGSKRICPQIAYVLDIQAYACVEKLTKQNLEQYRDYQIYVCDFQRKSRRFVKLQDKTVAQLNIQYLDDICRKIDEAYAANRKHHAVAANPITKSVAVPANENQPIKPSLWCRIKRGMKHPLRATWHVVLRTKGTIKRWRAVRRKRQAQRNYQKQIRQRNFKALRKYLPNLKPSALLLYVLNAKPNPNIQCTRLENNLRVGTDGELKGCCSAMVSLGDLVHDGELAEIWNSTYARIVKLSSLNRSYCLCNLDGWCRGYCSQQNLLPTEQWQTPSLPRFIFLSFDRTCNLCCKACRTEPYRMDETTRAQTATIVNKLLRSGWLEQVHRLELAGSGEVFYSPSYRQLLTTNLQRQNIVIKSNGTLFNESNWRLVANQYKTIDVGISMDAATAETYQKLRGGDFANLMRNLTMLSDLHRQKKIQNFALNFVVQRDNFREMPAFVKLGQALGVEHVQFQRMNNWGTFTNQEYLERCLIVENKYLDYELWCVLQDPIFAEPIVNLSGLQRYIDASERLYRQRYAREQKAKRSV